ncbi:mucin-like protein isoform X1 [Physella acuta]|uniref:mucin-like protein isoform X1 n=1 Tax=Physella acuta TaxID=109671 RepID=UPI0027DB6A49|nr:mucin-like protein isoform X1 [Physella acuta]
MLFCVPAWMLGDPTIVTLDNVTYLFNGRGEYIMMDVQSENFTLQARTDRAETSNGTLTNATVFTAFAAKEKEISHFQVELAASKTSMFLYVRGQNITESFYSFVDYRLSLETIEVFRDDSGNKTKVAVVFPCGVSFTFRVGYKSLELDMQAQKTLKGKTKGLLGNFNGNKKDEFTLPNGTVLRSNLTEREIFYNFANKYQVTQANSVFTYRDGKTALDYQFPDFVPFFNDSATASQLQKAREVCKNGTDSCVFDYMVTNDLNFAINTNNTISQSLTVKKILANSCPVLSVVRNKNYVNRRWLVQEGVANTLSFKAVDKDKDAVTYILVEGSSAVSLTQNGLLTYTPSVNSTVSVVLRVKDSQDCYSPVMIIPITICPRCSGHGQCNKNMTRETEYFGGLVKIFKCSCLPGYTGTNCESELDACKDNPCYKGQTCTDLTAAQQGNREIGYVCGPCPAGYTNYLGKCIDVDECNNPSRCENYCNNTDGGYECSCREGFVLNRTDAKTCLAKNCSNRCVTQNTLYCDEGVSQCVCLDGIKTPDCSVNVDKCLSKPCPANLMCVSTQTSYECLCLNGQRPINGGCADCNRQLTEVSGKFMSSNYPDNYPSNQFCTWTIMSNDSLAIISLNITEFVVEGCPYDYLEVYDGRDTNADLFGQYCTDAPGLVTSSGNSLTVTFTSDGSGNLKGFIASYAIESQCKNLQCSHSCQIVSVNPRVEKCVCPEWTRLDTVSGTKCLEINACNTTVTSSSGLIVSPGYPQKYGAYTTCYWTIPANTNTFTKLSFLDIDMEAGSTCPYDSIKVYDGTSSSAPLLSLVCEGVLPQTITSTGKGVFIVFKSDESIAGRGFKLQYG